MINHHKSGNRVSGFYRGIVLKHLPQGRCKIFIPDVYDDSWQSKPDFLPDAEQASPLFAGTNNGNGVFSYPNLSSIVWCFFANEDANYPVYFASTLGGQNAFGQYEMIMPPRYRDDQDLSNIISIDIQSNKHLITSGKSQVELCESGVISSIVCNPIRTDASVDYDNSYQLMRQDDHVIDRPICSKCGSDQIKHTECANVLDVCANNGHIETTTCNIDPESNLKVNTSIDQSNDNGVVIGTTYEDASGSSMSKMTLIKGESSIESSNSLTNAKLTIDSSTEKDYHEIKLADSKTTSTVRIDNTTGIVTIMINGPMTSMLTLDSAGNITAIGDTCISLTAPTILINGQAGDVKIDKVSLMEHQHFEMQSGDVVTAGTVKTKSAKESNS